MSSICKKGTLELLGYLFDSGATIDHNAVHKAVLRQDEDRFKRIEMLLSHGADINYVEDSNIWKDRKPKMGSAWHFSNPHHTTPIYEAARAGDVAMVEFLLNHGADPHVHTKRGRPGSEREIMNAVDLLNSSRFDKLREKGLMDCSGYGHGSLQGSANARHEPATRSTSPSNFTFV